MPKVRAGRVYLFQPVPLDQVLTQHHHAEPGQRVRVVKLPGAPPPNTMGHCHIEDADTKEFLGIVSTNSLQEN